MKILTRKNNKLFYKKYLYKVGFKFTLGNIFRKYHQRTDKLDFVLTKANEYKDQLINKNKIVETGYYRKISIDHNDIEDSLALRDSLNAIDDYTLRQESQYRLFIYVNNIDDLLPVLKTLKNVEKITVWKPDPAILKNTDPDVFVTKLAENYDFKVTLNMWKLREKNNGTLQWIKNNRDKVKITDYSIQLGQSFSTLYVRDEKVLMILQMTGNNFISRIERLVLPS